MSNSKWENGTVREKIDTAVNSPSALDCLEVMLSVKVNNDLLFPKEICFMCFDRIKLCYDLKQIYEKSQFILEKYVILNSYSPAPEIDATNECNSQSGSFDDANKSGVQEEMKESENCSMTEKQPLTQVKKQHVGSNSVILKDKSVPLYLSKCRHCHKSFPSNKMVKEHVQVCNKVKLQKCDYCTRIFPSITTKNYHIRLKHSAETGSEAPKYKCPLCNAEFKTSNARSYHKLTRHNSEAKIYPCGICGKAFLIKNSLSQHLEIHNKNVSKVICPICGKSFHYRGGLFYHMKVHRNERNYKCSFCPRQFLNMTSLKRHTRTHTGERPYVCSFCPKSFCSIGEVKTHERRHTGQKPHSCKYCKKPYISTYNLKFHMSSHLGNQPCDFCHKSFLNADVLKLHMEFKHKNKLKTSENIEVEQNEEFLRSLSEEQIEDDGKLDATS